MALENCIKDIKHWMIQNDLKLNTDKTAFLLFGTPQQLANTNISSFNAAGDIVERKLCARHLGVLLDSCLTMKDHISEVSKLAFYHLRNISHIRKYLTLSAAKTIVHALVCSRIDANSALFYGLPMVQIKKLQRIQNVAARVILRSRKYDHVTQALEKLNWLPVQYRILYKILIITYKDLHGQAPSYLSTLLRNKMCTSYGLRSDDNVYLLQTQRTHLVWGRPGILRCCSEGMEQTSLQRSFFERLKYIQDKAENASFYDMLYVIYS